MRGIEITQAALSRGLTQGLWRIDRRGQTMPTRHTATNTHSMPQAHRCTKYDPHLRSRVIHAFMRARAGLLGSNDSVFQPDKSTHTAVPNE